MPQITLEERVSVLEKELADLKQASHPGPTAKNWRKTVGMFDDDPGIEQVHRLGQEYRQRDRETSG